MQDLSTVLLMGQGMPGRVLLCSALQQVLRQPMLLLPAPMPLLVLLVLLTVWVVCCLMTLSAQQPQAPRRLTAGSKPSTRNSRATRLVLQAQQEQGTVVLPLLMLLLLLLLLLLVVLLLPPATRSSMSMISTPRTAMLRCCCWQGRWRRRCRWCSSCLKRCCLK
jgi:hypothetical protein